MKIRKCLLVLLFSVGINLFAQSTNLVWKNISVREITSSEVGDTFKVYVKLPDEYNASDKMYPVLYLLDGDIMFPMALSTVQYLEYGEHIPEMIIVGIGYGSLDWRTGNNRSRDYTMVSNPERPFQGGADKFLKFLESELIPEISGEYRVKENERILAGHSLGGQMVLYTMLNKPELFSGFIASSPFIYNVKNMLINLLEENSERIKSSGTELFISAGDMESKEEYLSHINELVKKLIVAVVDKKRVTYKVLKEAGHFTAPGQALTYGLIKLYE